MAEIELPPQAQQILMQLQTFQQQLNNVSLQKEGLNVQNLELERALEELKKAKDGEEVYKAVGPILIKSTKKELEKELREKKETADVKLKSLDKQEAKLKEKLKESQDKFHEFLKASEKSAG
jgi:prefoldin beta subunit